MNTQEKWKKLAALLQEIKVYERCIGKVGFDMECCAPEDGIEQAGDDSAVLEQRHFELTHSDEYTGLICDLHADHEGLNDLQVSAIEHLYKDYARTKNFSPEFNYEVNMLFNKAYGTWLKAKKASDYSAFSETLSSIVEIQHRMVEKRDDRRAIDYDVLLDDYEEGTDTEMLDAFFSAIRERVVPLVKRIVEEGTAAREDFMFRHCPIPKQEKFSRYLLELEGLQKSRLVLMTTEHPFTTSFGKNDVRVTTHYYEDNFVSNIFTTLHEGGHALFMCGEPEETYENFANDNMSCGMHECVSRFFENLIGRSRAFSKFIFPKVKETMGTDFDDVTEEEFYRAINSAKPSLIRVEADELTYSLHIAIRYEIEKMLMNGSLAAENVPEAWNEKYREYLGIDVPNDADGCLQDVHWTGGFGYFPSYALGNAYGAQILERMKKDIDVEAELEKGNLIAITNWLREHVFSIASVTTPDEWLTKITGEKLNVNYYLDYLENKFTALYNLG